jgi:hypothetical protein
MKKLAYAVLCALVVGCGPDPSPGPGNGGSGGNGGEPDGPLYLSIIGATNVALMEGEAQVLSVKYHDMQGHAVSGDVAFALQGTAAGAHIDRQTAHTDNLGIAQVQVTGGMQSSFSVEASAAKANPADWRIDVSKAAPPPLRWAGIYHLESTLDVGGGFPGGLGMTFRTIDDLTDGPYDPATWLIDQALAQINDPTISSIVNAFRPALDQELLTQIENAAPGLVDELRTIGQDITDVARRFGTGSDLVVEAHTNIDGTITVVEKHTLKSVIFIIDNTRHEFTFAGDLGMPEPMAQNIPGSVVGETTLNIGEHGFDVSYGRLILIALDRVIIPQLDPNANSIGQLLNDQIDCQSIGQSISSFVGFGSQQFWAGACTGAITAVGNLLEAEILRIDQTAGHLDWQGHATMVDHDMNRVVEALNPGRWTGTFLIAGETSTLNDSALNAFTGNRTSP